MDQYESASNPDDSNPPLTVANSLSDQSKEEQEEQEEQERIAKYKERFKVLGCNVYIIYVLAELYQDLVGDSVHDLFQGVFDDHIDLVTATVGSLSVEKAGRPYCQFIQPRPRCDTTTMDNTDTIETMVTVGNGDTGVTFRPIEKSQPQETASYMNVQRPNPHIIVFTRKHVWHTLYHHVLEKATQKVKGDPLREQWMAATVGSFESTQKQIIPKINNSSK